MTDTIRGRRISLNVLLPLKIHTHTEDELRLMLVTLRNSIVASSVHISRIENELRKRGVDRRILSVPQVDSLSDIDEAIAI